MVATSLKSMAEIRLGEIFHWPSNPSLEAWHLAWSTACTGVTCGGVSVAFLNSVKILVPSVILSILAGAINGYALAFWRSRQSDILFGLLLFGAFIPYQVFLYPMVRLLSMLGIYQTLSSVVLVHVVFGLPLTTLLFRNYYAGIPIELFKAARVDGGGFWTIFLRVMLPMSTPMVIVATIIQVTGIWNDFLFGLIFAGRDNYPMTVQLNNLVNTTTGEKLHNVNMAATIITAAVPLALYFISGRWFVRGIAAGAVKG
jgi:glucose/mannose transport system permease protein